MGALVLYRSSRLPHTQVLNLIWVLKKTAQNKLIGDALFPQPSIICLSEISSKQNPLQVPQGGPYGWSCPFPEPSLHVSQIPHKISPNK